MLKAWAESARQKPTPHSQLPVGLHAERLKLTPSDDDVSIFFWNGFPTAGFRDKFIDVYWPQAVGSVTACPFLMRKPIADDRF